jgi:outer membrane receptor protein involved in Fe transport
MSSKQVFSPRALLLVCLLLTAVAFGQTTASVLGTVTDSSGAAIAGAKVTVKNEAVGIERQTQTNASGDYEIPALPPGIYTVKVQSEKFATQIAKDLRLEVSRNSVQNFNMKVASSGEVVTVEANAATIESTTITVGQTIDRKTVQEIPLNGRHFVDLALLIPGTVTPPQNGFLTAPLRGQGSFAFNTAGNREDTVNFMVNGINLNDMVQNQVTFQPTINTVSEFKVDNSTYSAEYGRNSGAIVNIATRSGANGYHGELFEFVRNHDLDARNFFNTRTLTSSTGVVTANPQATFKRNSFGANFGGPIYKDKTFFFLSYEGLRQRQGIPLNTTVLSAAQRAQVQAGGNATSNQLLALIPSANSGNAFVGSALAPVNIDQGTADITHNFSSNLRLHGYYALQEDLRQEPTLQGDTLPGFGDTRQSRRQIATVSLDQTLSSSMVNEVRVGFNRIHIVFSPNALQNPASFGILDGINAGSGLPFISIGQTQIGLGGPNGFPQGRGDTTGVLSDTLNYVRGNHSLKFGGEFRRMTNNNFAADTGTLSFTTVAQFAAGTPTGFTLSPGNNPSRIAVNNLGFFVQDSWKMTRQLTVELGLRYDWNATPSEAQNRFVNFLPATDSLVQVDSPYKQNNKNFQPRLGFAYDVFGNSKTVVRGAYAILTDQPITGLVTGLTNNPPLGNPLSFVSGTKPTTTYATLIADAKGNGLAPTVVDPNFDNSYIESYNFNIQQQITSNWTLMTGYFGSAGRHLRTRINENQLVNGVKPFANLSASSPILPGAAVGTISDNVSNGNSSYNALWVTSNVRAFHGLQFSASYTFSKSIDYTSQNGQGIVLQNSLNPAGDKGLSDFDARHRFVTNFIYDFPFKGNRLIGGWQIGSIISDQSGNPVNLLASATGSGGLTGVASLRPDQIGAIAMVNTPLSSGNIQYFSNSVCDPAKAACAPGTSFAIPDVLVGTAPVFHFGNMGRNAIIGPGFNNVDMSLVKHTKISERFSSELRFEAFDLLNHANLGQPGRVAQIGSTSFGVISSTRFPTGDSGSARQLQFAAKLTF